VVSTVTGDWRANGFATGAAVDEVVNGGGIFFAVTAGGRTGGTPPRYAPEARALLDRLGM
jgi:hypothetical protein